MRGGAGAADIKWDDGKDSKSGRQERQLLNGRAGLQGTIEMGLVCVVWWLCRAWSDATADLDVD